MTTDVLGVWTESCSIFADVLRRSGPRERTRTWLPVERQGCGSERGKPPVAGGLSPSSSHCSNSREPSARAHGSCSRLQRSWFD